MDDNNWDIGSIVRNYNINKPNDVVAPSIGLEPLNFENDNINKSDNVVAPSIGLESLDFKNDDWNKFLDVGGTNSSIGLESLNFENDDWNKFLDVGGTNLDCLESLNSQNDDWNKFLDVGGTNFDCLESLNSQNDDWNKFLDVDGTNFDCSPEIFPANFSVEITNPITPAPIIVDQVIMNQNHNEQLLQSFQPAQLSQQIYLPSLPPPPAATLVNEPTTVAAAPQEWIDLQQQPEMLANVHPTLPLPMSTPLIIQTHANKNQPIKIIYELMQEELTNDTWIWHKNGEKHTKTSPFPRNYYKCVTTKDCKARKQIEKSPRGGNLFLVSYSGEHNHPPPTNARSQTSDNVSPKNKLPRGINTVPRALNVNSSAERSKRSRVIASPIVSTVPMLEIDSASPNKNEMMVVATETKGDEGEQENIVEIPN